jgi:hypothetical protein
MKLDIKIPNCIHMKGAAPGLACSKPGVGVHRLFARLSPASIVPVVIVSDDAATCLTWHR